MKIKYNLTKSIPANEILAGNTAKYIKDFI